MACDNKKNSEIAFFKFNEQKFSAHYTLEDFVSLELINSENKKVDSVVYFINDKKIATNKDSKPINFKLKTQKFGYQSLKALVYYDKKYEEILSRIEVVSSTNPKLLTYTIINTYPHDTESFTQGLEFHKDTLIEGTGKKGQSSLRKLDYKTGIIYKKINLEHNYFGEGITILNNKVYQLTWQEGVCFVYDINTFKKEKELNYFKNIEGWGLCNDGKILYMSDGTEKIWKVDPETFQEKDYINVYTNNSKIKSINELEYVNGKIYGNIWQKDALAIIDPKTGTVEAVVNLSELKTKLTSHPELDVLNGIAYYHKRKTFFITGKNWDKIFEIKIEE